MWTRSLAAVAGIAALGNFVTNVNAIGANCLSATLQCPSISLLGSVNLNTATVLSGNAGLTCSFGLNVALNLPLFTCKYDNIGALVVDTLLGSTTTACAASVRNCATCPGGRGLVSGDCITCGTGLFAAPGGSSACASCPTGFLPAVGAASCVATPVDPLNCLTRSSVCPSTDAGLRVLVSTVVTAGVQTCTYGTGAVVTQCAYDTSTGLLSSLSSFLLCRANTVKACTTCNAGFGISGQDCVACTQDSNGNNLVGLAGGSIACAACPIGFLAVNANSCVAQPVAGPTDCYSVAKTCPTRSTAQNLPFVRSVVSTGTATCNYGNGQITSLGCTYDLTTGLLQAGSSFVNCAANLVEKCGSCPAGFGFGSALGTCTRCSSTQFNPIGNVLPCQTCGPNFIPSADLTTCTPVSTINPTGCLTVGLTCGAAVGVSLTGQITAGALVTCSYSGALVCLYNSVTGLLNLGSDVTRCNANLERRCATCPAGQGLLGTGLCAPCAAGLFSPLGATGICQSCPLGYIPTSDQSSCSSLPAVDCLTQRSRCPVVDANGGTYLPALSSITTLNDQLSCVYSVVGAAVDVTKTCVYALSTGILTGTPVGSNNCFVTAIAECATCGAGFFLGANNTCNRCPAGTISVAGSTVCTPCVLGQIANSDQSQCIVQASIVARMRHKAKRL